jgi:hypothetical protein
VIARARASRLLSREVDGSLHDLDTRDVVTTVDLIDDLRAGKRFRVNRHDTGLDCTAEVLAEVLAQVVFGGDGTRRTGLLEPLLGMVRGDSRPRGKRWGQ